MDESGREWTEREAMRERESRRTCVACKTDREDLSPSVNLYTIETGEVICKDCLERSRRFGRDMDVDLRVNGSLDEHTQEVVRQSFRHFGRAVDGATEVVVATPEGEVLIGLELGEVDISEVDAADTPEVEP